MNAALLSRFDLAPEFLRGKLGIESRSVKSADEETSDLCVKAFADLRAQAGVTLTDVDLCCVVTQNPDSNVPHCAAIVHQKLGLPASCMTFDVSQGCAGYVHGLALVTSLMERLGLGSALLFTADPYSKIVDPDDKNTALIFGDAATATLLGRGHAGYALVDASFGTVPGSSSCLVTEPPRPDSGRARPRLQMDGTAVLFHATREVPKSVHAILQKNGKTIADVDRVLLHPGSKRVVDLLRRALELPEDRVPFAIGPYGNTVSSSIPIMLKPHVSAGDVDRLVMSGFGVGFSWGTAILERRGDHGGATSHDNG